MEGKGKGIGMKLLIRILVVIVLMLPIAGCFEVMTTENKNKLTAGVDGLITKVDEFQVVLTEVAKTDLLDAEETQKRNATIDEIQKAVVLANEAIKESPTLIEGVIKANQVTAPVNPYAGIIDAVLKIIVGAGVAGTAGMGIKAAKTAKEKKEVEDNNTYLGAKYSAFKKAADLFRIKHPEVAKDHYAIVGEERAKAGVS